MKKFFLIAVIAIFMVGCTKNDSISIGEGDTEVEAVDMDTLPEMDTLEFDNTVFIVPIRDTKDTIRLD